MCTGLPQCAAPAHLGSGRLAHENLRRGVQEGAVRVGSRGEAVRHGRQAHVRHLRRAALREQDVARLHVPAGVHTRGSESGRRDVRGRMLSQAGAGRRHSA